MECSGDCGHIVSAHFPGDYRVNQLCSWQISVVENHYIELEILDFDVNGLDTTCKGDFMDVFDVDLSGISVLMGHYCNRAVPPNKLYSSWNQIRIEFTSDSEGSGRGFHIVYRATSYSEVIVDETSKIRTRSGCSIASSNGKRYIM